MRGFGEMLRAVITHELCKGEGYWVREWDWDYLSEKNKTLSSISMFELKVRQNKN